MGITRKTFIVGSMVAAGAITSQAPEFAQQYRQRVGGAVEELRTVAQDFDRDADAVAKTRNEALTAMGDSTEQLVRNRATSMERTLTRFEALRGQAIALEKAPPLARPISVLDNPDDKIVADAWSAFEPAVPLTFSGLVWGGIGALTGWVFGWTLSRPFKRKRVPARAASASRRRQPQF